MEVPSSMLVALMFVTILTLGIANILGSLAAVVGKIPGGDAGRLQVSWKLLTLVIHFSLFWNTLEILRVTEWKFAGFLFLITGPVLVFFATSVLLAGKASADPGDPGIPARFFAFLAALQGWSMAVNLLFGGGLDAGDAFTAAVGIVLVLLAVRREVRLHVIGNAICWILGLALMVLRGAGVLP